MTAVGRTRRTGLRRRMMWSAIALLLILPAVAMRFTREVNWTAFDFAAAATLLCGAGLIYEFAASRITRGTHRAGVAALLGTVVLIAWAQGAVGVF